MSVGARHAILSADDDDSFLARPGMARSAFESLAGWALGAAAVAGFTVAWAPALPPRLGTPLVVVVLAAWTAGVLACSALAVRAAWDQIRARDGTGWLLIGAGGIAIALLSGTELELIRTLFRGPSFLWNWRWNLNHAHAIAQSGGVTRALDYAGAPLDYHAGPAWFAGAVERMLGAGITHVLFGLVPFLCVVTLAIAALQTLRSTGVRYRYGAAALAMALAVPLSDRTAAAAVYALPAGLLAPHSWPFLPTDLMMNSLLALAIGLGGLALILDHSSSWLRVALGSLALASLIEIKPQFYVTFGLLAGGIGVARFLGMGTAGRRDPRVVLAALASLPFAVASVVVFPGPGSMFDSPVLKAGNTLGAFDEAYQASTVLVLVALLAWWALGRGARGAIQRRPRVELLLASVGTVFLVAGVFHFVEFPCRPDSIARWLALGFDRSDACFAAFSAASSPTDGLGQSLVPPRFLILLMGFAILITLADTRQPWRAALQVLAVIAVASPSAVLAEGFLRPASTFAVADDPGLFRVLGHIPTRGTLLASSDLADPAQDFRRPLQGFLLTAYYGHAFYVADVKYVHFLRNDAPDRLRNLQRFFGSPWSEWHRSWLVRAGITHLVTDDRCRPVWESQADVPLKLLLRSGRWTAYEVALTSRQPGPVERSEVHSVQPAYGQAACLWGNRQEPAAVPGSAGQ
jgi:hypothetical protein